MIFSSKTVRIFILVLFFLITSSHFAEAKSEKYFVLLNGTRQKFTRLDTVSNDTVFFFNKSSKQFVMIDSIKSVNIYNHPPVFTAYFFGFLAGALTGGLVGSAFAKKDPGEGGNWGAFLIALPVVCVSSIVIGGIVERGGEKYNFDLQQCDNDERKKILKDLVVRLKLTSH